MSADSGEGLGHTTGPLCRLSGRLEKTAGPDPKQAEHAEALAAAPKSARDAAGLVVRSPAITADLLQTELGMSQPTAYRTLERLQEAEVIRRNGYISGARAWISPAVVDTLDAFAARAGRRTRAQ